MTVVSELCRVQRLWTGVETIFPTGFQVLEAEHCTVSINGIVLTQGVQYGVQRAVNGLLSIIPLALPAAPQTLLIERVTPALQPDDLQNYDTYDAGLLERQLDAAAMRDAENGSVGRDIFARALLVPSGETGFSIPARADRFGKVLVGNADGGLTAAPVPGMIGIINANQIIDSTAIGRAILTAANEVVVQDEVHAAASFQTMAVMQAAPVPTVERLTGLLGLVSPGDAGGGLFRYVINSTDVPDNKNVIKPNSVVLPAPGRYIRVLSYNINSKRRTLIGLGISDNPAINQAPALNAAFASIEKGDYIDGQGLKPRIDATVAMPAVDDCVIENFSLNCSNIPGGQYSTTHYGTQGAGQAVAQALTKNTYYYTIANAVGFNGGRFVLFERPCIPGTGFASDNYAENWWGRIRNVAGNAVTLVAAYDSEYTIAAGGLQLFQPSLRKGTRFHRFGLFREGLAALVPDTSGMHCYLTDGIFRDDCEFEGFRDRAWYMDKSINFKLMKSRFNKAFNDGASYGDCMAQGCQDYIVAYNTYWDMRHGTVAAGGGGICSNGQVLFNTSIGCRSSGFDTHANARNMLFKGNRAFLSNSARDDVGAGSRNNEGFTSQAAHTQFINSEIHGLFGNADAGGAGVLVQNLTRMPNDSVLIHNTIMRDVAGGNIIAIYVENQKPSGDFAAITITNSQINAFDFGGNGLLSPRGIVIQTHPDGTNNFKIVVNNNIVRTRGTALRLATPANKLMSGGSITGNTFETINSDVPCVEISAATPGYIERIGISGGGEISGGNYGVSNSGGARILVGDPIIGGYSVAAINGTVTQPAGAANYIRT